MFLLGLFSMSIGIALSCRADLETSPYLKCALVTISSITSIYDFGILKVLALAQ